LICILLFQTINVYVTENSGKIEHISDTAAVPFLQ